MNLRKLLGMMTIAASIAVAVHAGEIPPAPTNCSLTTTTFSNTTDYAIADGAGVTISDIQVNTAQGMSIYDVNLTVDIEYGHSQDLKLYLIPPAGKVIVLSTLNGGTTANVYSGTVFDDDAGNTNAPGAVTDVVLNSAEPNVVPESAMATMVGYNPTGKWSLYVYDTVAANGGGLLKGWSLEITAMADNPTETTYSFSNSNISAINDTSTLVSTVQVNQNFPIYEARLRMMIDHTYNADLDITLTSPQGTTVTISTDNGGSYDNVFSNVLFSDKGWYPVTDIDFNIQPVLESAIPEEAMGALTGEDSIGTWTLSVTDDTGNDTGVLKGWTLELSTASCGGNVLYDDFEDNVLTTDWKLSGQWTESNHVMTANAVSKSAAAMADFADPCTDCSIRTQFRTNGGDGHTVTLIGWYKDRDNRVELMMKAEKNIWLFKEFSGGVLVQKKKFNELFAIGSYYDVRLQYNAGDNSITIFVNNYPYGTMQLHSVPNGVAGVKVKRTVADFTGFSVQQN